MTNDDVRAAGLAMRKAADVWNRGLRFALLPVIPPGWSGKLQVTVDNGHIELRNIVVEMRVTNEGKTV
jgi:hypothetical protein